LLKWELRLPRLASAQPLLLVSIGTRLVVGPLVVLIQLLVQSRYRLLLHVLKDAEL
jgi:hypothetical protein